MNLIVAFGIISLAISNSHHVLADPDPETVLFYKFQDSIAPFDSARFLHINRPASATINPINSQKYQHADVINSPGFDEKKSAAGKGSHVIPAKMIKSKPNFVDSFEGVNAFDSSVANSAPVEPSDQGLCVGNGFILHTVNSALQVYTDSGNGTELTAVTSLNDFHGFPSHYFSFDIECHYDPNTKRWFHVAVNTQSGGLNYQNIAVSKSDDPTGEWDVYRLPSMNDGTEGTPDHGCGSGPCFGDFPHFAVNKHGFFLTTNEFSFKARPSAQIYAISKDALLNGDAEITAYLFNTARSPWTINGGCRLGSNWPGFTVWPAKSAGRQVNNAAGGVQFFVSSDAPVPCFMSKRLHVWSLMNTASLSDSVPSLQLKNTFIDSQKYAIPSNGIQKIGPNPYGESIGHPLPLSIDTSDGRVLDVRFANNKLWVVQGTYAEVEGKSNVGVAWYILNPSIKEKRKTLTVSLIKNGIIALKGEHLAYPAIAVTTSGKGVIAVSCFGPDRFPSACYAPIDSVSGVGEVVLAAEGKGPQDGWTQYGRRHRWGEITVQQLSMEMRSTSSAITSNLAVHFQSSNWITLVAEHVLGLRIGAVGSPRQPLSKAKERREANE